MTLKEFWESPYKMTIHCRTKEQTKKLLKAFNDFGKCWASGDSYLELDYWGTYKNRGGNCYSNNNTYLSYLTASQEGNNYIIFEFEEVELL